MQVEIRKLAPDLAEDYVRFFDITPHDVNIDARKCYCVTWRSDASYADAGHWFPTRAERRERALQFVRNGDIQGYLAYQGDEIIGWCNANADCQGCLDYLRGFWPIDACAADIKVKSIFCFTVAPKAQRMGVATQLLQRVCEDAAADGFDFVEAYVNKADADLDFTGPLAMYDHCGFQRHAEREGRIVVRKALKA